jgi:hypothetical protein
VGTYGRASFSHVDLLQAGEQSVPGVLVVIQSVAQLTAADPLIRGILANNFLSHFDLLIDNRQRLLCLDKSGNSLSSHFRGERIALAEPYGQGGDMPFMRPILISARRSTEPDIPLILRLDSGSNVPVLYAPKQEVQERFTKKTKLLQRIVNGSEQVFEVLPAQDLKIGSQDIRQVSFVLPLHSAGGGPALREDGVLPTMAFQRIFISNAAQYVSFENW